MGRFAVDVDIANNWDVLRAQSKLIAPDEVRREVIRGVVDSGATRLVLPKAVVQQLGLRPSSKAKVRYADGRTTQRDVVQNVFVELMGRSGVFSAIVEPRRTSALIGAIVLEEFDLLVDCQRQKLVPRDPRIVVSEIE